MFPTLVTRASVPRTDEAPVSYGPETDPASVGADREELEAAWKAVTRLYASGIHPAIQLCVRRKGEVILDRAIGYARGAGPNDGPDTDKLKVSTDTPFNIFSASKAITAMVIHLLDQRHLVHLEDPVCDYIPHFGTHGKQWITIRHLLTHRAGIPNLPPDAIDLDLLSRPNEIIDILCESELSWRPGRRLGYHAITGGFLLGEIVRRVTGISIRAFLDRELRGPLRFKWLNYGVPRSCLDEVAWNYFTGPPVLPPVSTVLRRALGIDFHDAVEVSNDPRFALGIIPAGNVFASANELSRFYQLLLDGGELDGVRIFDSRTIRRATAEQSYREFDLTLAVPLRYGMGFMLGGRWFSPYGPDTQHAFGHLGFTNILGWADPERGISAALLTSGKPVVYPELFFAFDVLRRIGNACPKQKLRPWRKAVVVPVRSAER
ncbi:MAG: serine hydrolase domain-containing protein [Deltaproteobacteria bacterium]